MRKHFKTDLYITKYYILIIISISFLFINQLQSEPYNLDKLLSKKNIPKNDSAYLYSLFNYSYINRTFNPDTSIYLLKELIEKAEKNNLPDLFYNASLLLGATYKDIGYHSNAIQVILELLKVCEKKGDIDKQAKCLSDLGEQCRAGQQFEAGIKYLECAIDLSKKANDSLKLAIANNRLAAIYLEYKDLRLTQLYLDSSMKICENMYLFDLMISNLEILGSIHFHNKEYKKAIETYFKAIKICDKINLGDEAKINTYINLSRVYLRTEMFDSSLIFAKKAYDFAIIYNIPIYEENSTVLISKSYAAINNYKDAYHYLYHAMGIRSFLFNESKNSSISNLNKKYEIEKKEQEIENQKLIIRNNEIFNYFLIASVLFLLALFIGVLFFVHKIKKKNTLLKKTNKQIESQHDKLQYFTNELEKSNNVKDRFFSIIAHDLKSPFNSLLGLSEMLRDSLESFNKEEITKVATALNKTSRRTFDLLVNLLEWARTQTNKIEYNPKEIRINDLVQSNIELNESAANSKSINLIFKVNENIVVYADINMLNTVVSNLISNAIKFTQNGNIIIQITKSNEYCKVSIEDSGVGISEENLKKLFQLNQYVSTAGTHGEIGTGLGLILCKEFIEINKGTIYFKSELHKGSIFSFSIPLASNNESKLNNS